MHLLHTNKNLRATAAQWTSLSGLWPLHAVRKRLFRNAIVRLKKRIFVKTGSGQSHGKLKRKEVSLQEVLEEERCGSR